MNERTLQFRVGLFVLLSIGIATALIIQFGEVQKYWKKTYAIAVHFDEASGTHPGCPVRMNGVLIGEVKEVLLDEAEPGVLVILSIEEDRRIRRDAKPYLSKALFGDAAIEFSGGRSSEFLPPNKRLHGEAPTDPLKAVEKLERTVSETLASFESTSREWQLVGKNINSLVETERGNLGDVIERAAVALDTLTKTMDTASHTLASANKVLDDPELQNNLKRTIAALPEMAEETKLTITAARTSIQKMSENLDKLSAATDPLAAQSQSLVGHLDKSLVELESLLTEMNSVAKAVNSGDGTLRKFAEDPELYNNLNRSASSLSLLLGNLTPIMADVRVFSDKVSRHPELLGISGALSGSSGIKNPGDGVEPAAYEEKPGERKR